MSTTLRQILGLAAGLAAMVSGWASAWPSLQDPRTSAAVPWTQWEGAWVVFDFYAPWCGPCAGVSRDLHEGIAEHYRQEGGGLGGRRVEVVPVNIDAADATGMQRFLKRAGLQESLVDPQGRVFEAWGGKSVPFVVVVDGSGATANGPGRILARFEGHPGVERLRGLLASAATGEAPGASTGVLGTWIGPHTEGTLEVTGEGLLAEDMRLYQAGVSWLEKRPRWDVRVQYSANFYDLDYRPAPGDFVSQPEDLFEVQSTVQGRTRVRWADRWQAEVQGGVYAGFSDARSLWLDEYYRQYFGGVRGYVEADPGGWNVAPGVRWEAVPGAAWVQAGLVFQEDDVSPGYEAAPFRPLVRGTEHLSTLAGTASLENVLTPQWRAQHSLRVTDTTDRDLRYEYTLSLRWSAAEHWVVRGAGGTTLEPPDFEAYQGQLGLEYDWANRWFVGFTARYYTDNGLVRDPKIVSNASPPLETWQLTLVLRHDSERWQAKLMAGPYWTLYDPVPAISRHFAVLYADRDWAFVQASLAYKF